MKMRSAWLDRFCRLIVEKLDAAEAEEILTSVAGGESLSRLRKARCIAGAVTLLEHCVSEAVVTDILQGCACEFSQLRISVIQQLYNEASNLKDFWMRLDESKLMGEYFEVREGWIVVTKNPYRPDLKACYPEDSFAWYCHCGSIVKPLHGNCSPAICHCGAGFYRPLFVSLFSAPVQIEVRESLLKGNDRCVIAIRVPTD